MAELVPVTFAPSGRTARVEEGVTVLDAAREAGELINAPCAGRGVCGGCGVRLVGGSLDEPDAAELNGLRRAPDGVRLACRARVQGAATVRPIVTLDTVANPVRERERRMRPDGCVAAVDLGTTTVAAIVIDADSRVELGRSAVLNRQRTWGADVLSRIVAARDGESDKLREAAEDSIRDALATACTQAGACLGAIERLVIAGNTAMSSLLLGIDVEPLVAYPFEPPYALTTRLSETSALAGELAEGACAIVLPPLAGFVGGDALAGVVATGLDSGRERTLFLDMGTNAELVLASSGRLFVASTAAGPAFEASGLASGGPATVGAVQRVGISEAGEVVLDVIGDVDAAWLSGSGLVSLVAELRRLGHIDASGRMNRGGPLAERFVEVRGVETLVVAREGDARVGRAIYLDQNDVRALQLAKGAVRAAIETLFEHVGDDEALAVREVAVAGNFGGALQADDLADLGILPRSLSKHFRAVGNAALVGAEMIAVDPTLEDALSAVTASVRHVDLAGDPGFAARFLDSLALEAYDAPAG